MPTLLQQCGWADLSPSGFAAPVASGVKTLLFVSRLDKAVSCIAELTEACGRREGRQGLIQCHPRRPEETQALRQHRTLRRAQHARALSRANSIGPQLGPGPADHGRITKQGRRPARGTLGRPLGPPPAHLGRYIKADGIKPAGNAGSPVASAGQMVPNCRLNRTGSRAACRCSLPMSRNRKSR